MAFFPSYIPNLFQPHRPGIPLLADGVIQSLIGLKDRRVQLNPALQGLKTSRYQIGGNDAPAYDYLFGTSPDRLEQALTTMLTLSQQANLPDLLMTMMLGSDGMLFQPETSSLTRLSLERAEDWRISLTNLDGELTNTLPLLPRWERSLTDPDAATRDFWPMIAENGLAYNLLMLRRAGQGDLPELRGLFGTKWNATWEAAGDAGRLYFIDLRIFAQFPAASVDGHLRYTPGTVTLLVQNADTKELLPVAVRVAGDAPSQSQVYTAADKAWLYGLQAAKVSVTVYGIWLGHVYHWHIVTAAMFMSMRTKLPQSHPVAKLLRPQANFLIQFDEILLSLWRFIAPPTSFDSSDSFLRLMNAFAEGREFFHDDPLTELQRHGIEEANFSVDKPWDRYPIVAHYLDVWAAVCRYVDAVVDLSYANDFQVNLDMSLKAWMTEASFPILAGNIRGLPSLSSRMALKQVLRSLIYRVTMHGCSRLHKSLSPALSWVGNYPVCLQKETLPSPDTDVSQSLFSYMPKTGTIGLMVRFYDIFIYSKPYTPLIPLAGIDQELFYGPDPGEPRNQALIGFRKDIEAIMGRIQPNRPQPHQWPQSIET